MFDCAGLILQLKEKAVYPAIAADKIRIVLLFCKVKRSKEADIKMKINKTGSNRRTAEAERLSKENVSSFSTGKAISV